MTATLMIDGLAVRCVAEKARNPAGPPSVSAVTMAEPMARIPCARRKSLIDSTSDMLIPPPGRGADVLKPQDLPRAGGRDDADPGQA
ncbi:hypothetical protein GCM10011319_18830 [Mameliella alba]|nr:hypothetical protein GCM10011319_18830 [Mameliella alba]